MSSRGNVFRRLAVCSLIVAGLAAYSTCFQGEFFLDDITQIVENKYIRSFQELRPLLNNTRRPVLYLSFAFDYLWGGLHAWKFHLVNLLIHISAALILFGIIRQSCLLPQWREKYAKNSTLLAFVVSLIWIVHPLNTQSVTYIVQRAESLMGLFFLMTLYSAIRFWDSPKSRWLYLTLFACLAGGLTKEVIFVAPFIVFLFDITFISRSSGEAWQKHKDMYIGYVITLLIMLYLLFTLTTETVITAGFAMKDITPWQYAINQPPVILHYLKLSLWPHPLVFDYFDWLPHLNYYELSLPLLGVLILIVLSVLGFRKRSLAGFLGICFFLILAPSSSFIPLKDLAFEHRMYLPLVCVILLAVICIQKMIVRYVVSAKLQREIFICLAFVAVITFGFLTFQRNKVYHSQFAMWQDVVAKRPQNVRAQTDLGIALARERRFEEAMIRYKKAIEYDASYKKAYLNMAAVLVQLGRYNETIEYAMKAIEIDDQYAKAYANLGTAYLQKNQPEKAIPEFEKALELGFHHPGIYHNLVMALKKAGRTEEAEVLKNRLERSHLPDDKGIFHSTVLLKFQSE